MDKNWTLNRREALALAAAFAGRAIAQTPAALLPLRTTGLEHLGMTVPDQKASAEFYGRIFDPQLFQERDPPPRYYVRLGTAYIAFGAQPTSGPPLMRTPGPASTTSARSSKTISRQEMRAAIEQAGNQHGDGAVGNADGFRRHPPSVIGSARRTGADHHSSTRISTDERRRRSGRSGSHRADRVRHGEVFGFLRKVLRPAVSRSKKPERTWFGVAQTRLALETGAAGSKPAIERVCVKIAGFDRRVTEKNSRKQELRLCRWKTNTCSASKIRTDSRSSCKAGA